MIAAFLHAPRDLTIEDRPSLSPGVGEAVIRVEGAGLCGTDYRIWNGNRAVDYPRVMGHELSGLVEEAASNPLVKMISMFAGVRKGFSKAAGKRGA